MVWTRVSGRRTQGAGDCGADCAAMGLELLPSAQVLHKAVNVTMTGQQLARACGRQSGNNTNMVVMHSQGHEAWQKRAWTA
jgi:hypothetical protein